MSNLPAIQETLRAPATQGKLMLALGHNDPQNPEGKNDARRYCASVLAEIEKTAGDKNKDLTVCRPDSIVQCMIDAAQFKIMIDGRQHAHIVKYGNRATLQIGYRAYLAKIKEHYPDADFTVEPIYNGDNLEVWHDESGSHYKLAKKSVFGNSDENLQGVLFAVKYTENGRLISKVVPVDRSRIDRARKAAKQDFIWKTDFIEKAKAAAIKNACKHLFASLTMVQEISSYDNNANFDVDKPAVSEKQESVLDNLNADINTQPDGLELEEDENEVIDADFTQDEEAVVI
jgi:recombinational DNA repair protein RecT